MRTSRLSWNRVRYAIAGAASTVVLASCSLALDANTPQCSTTQDCLERGASFAATTCVDSRCAAKLPATTLSLVDAGPPVPPDDAADPWRCTGHVAWPAPSNETVIDHEIFTHFTDGHSVPGLTVETCASSDVECTSPLETLLTDATGAVAIPMTKGFSGYLQLKTPPASFPGLMPTIAPYVFPPGADPAARSQLCVACGASGAALAVSRGEIGALAGLVGAAVDPSRGVLYASMLDCDNHVAAGLQLEVEQADDKSAGYYFKDGLPAAARTETGEMGEAGFVNVKPGVVSVKSRRASTGQVIGARTVLVRAGTLTLLYFPPTPL